MAYSNRHWPSMFKSKPSNPHHQWQHDINSSLISTGCQRSPYTSAVRGNERNPEPKPRWNPKPEQIRILESIFNSGMVNPPRDEIRKIKIQLQEYGEVGDANVFYWFQNRKSRSKNKLRQLQNTKEKNPEPQQNSAALPQITTAPTSSSSSSEKSSPKEIIIPPNPKGFSLGFSNVNYRVPNSPTGSVNQTYFQTQNETNFQLPTTAEPLFFPLHHNDHEVVVANNAMTTTQGLYSSDFFNMIQPQPQQNVGPYTSPFLSEILNYGTTSKEYQDQDKAMKIMHQQPQLSFCLTPTPITVVPPITDTQVTVPSYITQLQGVGEEADGTAAKCTVFINDVVFDVAVGPFNVREAFGNGAMLIHSSGNPVLTDEFGVTIQSLQHGASYYLLWCVHTFHYNC